MAGDKRDAAPLNVILIGIDTLRADRLGCYGYRKKTSPFIDQLAGESVVFEHAVSQASWTLPSFVSLFTSLYTDKHGVTDPSKGLGAQQLTLAKVLRSRGYKTAAFVNLPWFDVQYGMDSGFDTYVATYAPVSLGQALPAVFGWLAEHRRDPFFVFLHTMDVHPPYRAPPWVAQ